MIRRPPRSTLFPTRRSSDLTVFLGPLGAQPLGDYATGSNHVLPTGGWARSEEHTSELQSRSDLVCRLLLEKKKNLRFKLRVTDMREPDTVKGDDSFPAIVDV